MNQLKDTLRGFIVPIQVLEDSALSAFEKLVYIVLRSFVNAHKSEAFPSIHTICKLSGIGRTKVKETLAALESKGYIQRSVNFKYNPDTKKSRQTSNVYTLDLPENTVDPSRTATPTPVATRPDPQSPHDHHELINKELINKEEEEDTRIGESIDSGSSSFENQFEKNRRALFGNSRDLTESQHWFLVYVTDGKFNLNLAKHVVKRVDISKISKKVLFTVMETAVNRISSGEIKHPVNWIVSVFENEQMMIEILGGAEWVRSGKS